MCNVNEETAKKRVLSCIQPSGLLTLGNYLGALKNWAAMQEEFDCTFAVADLHAITVRQEPAKLRSQIYSTFSILLALGIDPEKNTVFIQSQVPEHTALSWLLSCYTQFGEMSRMTQFKDKSAKNAQNINAGLFTYPALMASDILLYQADLVPVGIDQKQHLELTRDIAERFNQIYGDTFVVPECYMAKTGAKICSLADPTKKMSKSDENPNACVRMLDSKDDVIRKFKRAVPDSDTVVKYADGKDGINNLMSIYSCFTGKSFEEIEKEFEGRGYGDFKLAVGEACADGLAPIQEEFKRLMADKAYLEGVMRDNADQASYIARKTLSKVYRKVGFLAKP